MCIIFEVCMYFYNDGVIVLIFNYTQNGVGLLYM